MGFSKQFSIALITMFSCSLLFSCVKNNNPNPPSTTDSTVNLQNGLLLYLPFSGSIADSSGNNNPTQATGNVLTYDEHGYPNQAFGATGNGERVYVTNNGSIKFDTAWSLSFGFMVNDNRQEYLMSMVDPATGQGPSFTMSFGLPAVPQLTVGTEDITLGCENYGGNDNINVVDTSTLVPVPGAWYNAIAIYHKGSVSVYINGRLNSKKTGQGTASNLCGASQIVIGGWWDGDPLSLNGKLDDIRLYNRILTPGEIAQLASSYQVNSNAQPRLLQQH